MKGISFNSDGIKIKEDSDLYHDRIERLIYMSGVIVLLEQEPDLDISAISGETVFLTQEKSGLKLKFEFNYDKNVEIDNKNFNEFTFFSIYEA